MRKLTIKNDWESYEYYADNEKINPKDIHVVYDEEGNGHQVRHEIEHKSYNDMGHTYTASRTVLCVSHPLGEVRIREKSNVYVK